MLEDRESFRGRCRLNEFAKLGRNCQMKKREMVVWGRFTKCPVLQEKVSEGAAQSTAFPRYTVRKKFHQRILIMILDDKMGKSSRK